MNRRSWLVLAAALLCTTMVWAGSYMDRTALLINEARRASHFLRQRSHDKELARIVHHAALARLEAAQTMSVPKEVALAHPHVLIVLEHHERAANAAENGDVQKFLVYELKSEEEERVLRSVFEQLGWPLPKP
jgi:heme exporter protein D